MNYIAFFFIYSPTCLVLCNAYKKTTDYQIEQFLAQDGLKKQRGGQNRLVGLNPKRIFHRFSETKTVLALQKYCFGVYQGNYPICSHLSSLVEEIIRPISDIISD